VSKLGDLKRLLDAARANAAQRSAPAVPPAPAPAPPARPLNRAGGATHHAPHRFLASTKHAADDVDLAKAFADVKRLPPSTKARIERARPAPIARQRLADDRDALLASKFGAEPAPHSWEVGQEHESGQTYVRHGLGSDVLGKLRRGHWSLQAEIDLHGMIVDEAHDALADFLVDARNRGHRCVRVIHGKGLTSPGREPILKGKVRKWLSHWDDVLAYAEAPRHAGGGGAVVVLLKGAR
jgi:DNA-nicking Smr family endonuclease